MNPSGSTDAGSLEAMVRQVIGHQDGSRFVEILPQLSDDLNEVDAVIQEALRSTYPFLTEAANYATASGGKRLRPLVILVVYRGLTSDATKPVHPLAAAFQLIHTASLVHDDLIDHAPLRRGKPSVHEAFGLPTAIVAGDYLFVRAFQLAGRYSPEVIQRCGDASADLALGEVMQENSRFDLSIDRERYLRIVTLKTANAIAAGAEAAAMVARAEPRVIRSLGEYGQALGIAFQLKDDALDMYGESDVTGKPLLSDLREGLPTLPSILAYQRLSDREREEFERLFTLRHKRQAHLLRLKELCDTAGVREPVEREAEKWVTTAIEALHAIPPSPFRDLLEAVASGSIQRKV